MRNSLNDIVRRSARLKDLNSISTHTPFITGSYQYQHQVANLYVGRGLQPIQGKGRRRRMDVCTLCSCPIVSPLMRNYLLRRSYTSEALRTIDTPCDQYTRVKQSSKALPKFDTKKTAAEPKQSSLIQIIEKSHEKLKNGHGVSSRGIAEIMKKHKPLSAKSNPVSQLSTNHYEMLIELLEFRALNVQKSTSWARIRELFEEYSSLRGTPTWPILQIAITAFGRSGQLDKCEELVEQVNRMEKLSRSSYIETHFRLFEAYMRQGKSKPALGVLQSIKNELSNESLVKAIERMAGASARRNNAGVLFQTLELVDISLIASNKHVARKVIDTLWKGQWLAITDMVCESKEEKNQMLDTLRRLDINKSQDFSFICQHIIVQALRNLDQSSRKHMQLEKPSNSEQWMPTHHAQLFLINRVALLVELTLTAFPKLQLPSQCMHDLSHLFAISGNPDAFEKMLSLLRKRNCIPIDKNATEVISAFEVSQLTRDAPSISSDEMQTSRTFPIDRHQQSAVRFNRDLNDIHSQHLAKALMQDFLASKQWDQCLELYGKMMVLNQDFALSGKSGLLEYAIIAHAAQKQWNACNASLRQAIAHPKNDFSSDFLKRLLNRMVHLYRLDRTNLSGSRIVRVMEMVEQTCKVKLDIAYTNALIRKLGEERDLQAARRLYKWVLEPQGQNTHAETSTRAINRATFHAIMNAAVHNNDIDLAIQAYTDLLHRWRPRLPEVKSEESLKAHESQINQHLEPTLITYNILLNAYASRRPSPKFSQIYNLYRRMLVRQVEPDQVTYSTLAKAFSKTDDQELVREVLHGKPKPISPK
jgi:PPR repeat family